MNLPKDKSDVNIPAIILAAGKGLRLGKYTNKVPKPLLKIGSIPIIDIILINLIKAGITQFLIIVGYKADMIITWINDYFLRNLRTKYKQFIDSNVKSVKISFVRQEKISGTGSATLYAEKFISTNRYTDFLLTYGDILVSGNAYKRLIDTYQKENHELFLVGSLTDDPSAGAAIYYSNDKLINLIEKPGNNALKTDLNNAGIYIFKNSIFNLLTNTPSSNRGEIELTTPIIEIIKSGKSVRLIKMKPNEFWCDVGTIETYEELNAERGFLQKIFS